MHPVESEISLPQKKDKDKIQLISNSNTAKSHILNSHLIYEDLSPSIVTLISLKHCHQIRKIFIKSLKIFSFTFFLKICQRVKNNLYYFCNSSMFSHFLARSLCSRCFQGWSFQTLVFFKVLSSGLQLSRQTLSGLERSCL